MRRRGRLARHHYLICLSARLLPMPRASSSQCQIRLTWWSLAPIMPHLAAWLAQFELPSAISIGATYLALSMTQRHVLDQDKIAREFPRPPTYLWWPPDRMRDWRGRRRALVLFGSQRIAWAADFCLWRCDDHDCACIESAVTVAGHRWSFVGCVAAGCWLICSG